MYKEEHLPLKAGSNKENQMRLKLQRNIKKQQAIIGPEINLKYSLCFFISNSP